MNEDSYILTDLGTNPEFYDELVALIESEFHYTHNQSFIKDFAPLISPLNFENCLLIIDKKSNKLIAHLALCPRTLIKNSHIINVCFIGGIVTDKFFRNKGLFKNLMNFALKKTEDNYALYFLWSDLSGIYEKFNFHLAGGLVESGNGFFSDNDKPLGFQKTHFSELSEEDFREIISIYTKFNEFHFFTVKREEKDWSIIREMSSIDLYIGRDENGSIEKYFCVNKGRDLANIIHEIGCVPEKYQQLIKQLKPFRTWLPESENKLIESHNIFYNAFIKIGNLKLLNIFLNSVTDGKLNVNSVIDEKIEFQFNKQIYHCSNSEFKSYLFGPRPLAEFEDFHLSPYIAGCDSI